MSDPRFRVLASDGLADSGKEIFAAHPEFELVVQKGKPREELLEMIGGFDALAVRSGTKVDAELLERATRLKAVGRAGVGVDNIDIPTSTSKGVVVMNTPGGNTITTAEHTVSLMMAAARHVAAGTASVKAGRWERGRFVGTELNGKTLGIVGLGNIGRVVARIAAGLNMRVVGSDPFMSAEGAKKIGVELLSFEEMIPQVDVVTVHVPMNDQTRGLIGRDALSKMKDGLIVVNCARGGIVDEEALLEALESGKVKAAGLDVYTTEPPAEDNPLLKHERVVSTPHLGASTEEAQENVSRDVARQIVDYLKNGVVQNGLNTPSMDPKTLEAIGPYVGLCERMGAMAAQLAHKRGPSSIVMEYDGGISEHDVGPLTLAALKGFLTPAMDVPVNAVNAPGIAESRGLKVIEAKTATAKDFTSSVQLVVKHSEGELTLRGVLFGTTEPRIVGVNQFRMEVHPEGHILAIHNNDQPGVVGKIGTTLGNAGVNIARMQLGLDKEQGEALAMINVDSAVPEAIIEYLRAVPEVLDVRQIKV